MLEATGELAVLPLRLLARILAFLRDWNSSSQKGNRDALDWGGAVLLEVAVLRDSAVKLAMASSSWGVLGSLISRSSPESSL